MDRILQFPKRHLYLEGDTNSNSSYHVYNTWFFLIIYLNQSQYYLLCNSKMWNTKNCPTVVSDYFNERVWNMFSKKSSNQRDISRRNFINIWAEKKTAILHYQLTRITWGSSNIAKQYLGANRKHLQFTEGKAYSLFWNLNEFCDLQKVPCNIHMTSIADEKYMQYCRWKCSTFKYYRF